MRSDDSKMLLFLLSFITLCYGTSPPGKPVLLSCRSPDKETFTCWWEPGSDGGLPTTHRLYYEREDRQGTHECPDYQSAGKNSCFFSKKHTLIWVTYSLRVVASNILGNTTSDPLDVDVMYIMQPNAPEKVELVFEDVDVNPYLSIKWDPPDGPDTKSGWVTMTYQVRVKEESGNKWEEYLSGKQSHFNLYSLHPGAVYIVQVRCKLDHSRWSEWSNPTSIRIPEYNQTGAHFGLLTSVFGAVVLTALMCVLIRRRKCVRLSLMPPVPGPKIKGFDAQLVRSGQYNDDSISSLIDSQSFLSNTPRKDQMEDYLIVFDSEDFVRQSSDWSHKKRHSLIVPNSLNFRSDVSVQDSSLYINNCNAQECKTSVRDRSFSQELFSYTDSLQFTVPTQMRHYTERTDASMDSGGPYPDGDSCPWTLSNGGYVDVERQEGVREFDDSPVVQDYSKVSAANEDNMLFLQRDGATLKTSCGEKGYCSTEPSVPKSKDNLTTEETSPEACTDIPNSGYVEISTSD